MLIYFLPTILALGIVTSYEDVKEGKIRNKYIIAGLVLSILIHSSLFLFRMVNVKYLLMVGIYVLIALAIGFFIWFIGLWSAGDAKLYVVYVSLVPLITYKYISTDLPMLALLVNTIMPAFVYLLIQLIVKTNAKQKLMVLKKILNWKYLLNILLIIFSIGWITHTIYAYLGIDSNYLYNIMGIIIIATILQKILKKEMIALLVVIAILRVFLNKDYILRYEFMISFLVITLGYVLVMMFIRGLGTFYTRKVNVYLLKDGMILAEAINKKGFKIKKLDFWQSRFGSEAGLFLDTGNKALTKQDIIRIQAAHRKGKLHFNNLLIQQTLPLSPLMFLGVLMMIICQGNVFIFLRAIF